MNNLYRLAFEFVYTQITLLLRLCIVVCSNFIPYEQPLYQLASKFIARRLLSSTKTVCSNFIPYEQSLPARIRVWITHADYFVTKTVCSNFIPHGQALPARVRVCVHADYFVTKTVYCVVCSNFIPYEQPLYQLASEFIARRLLLSTKTACLNFITHVNNPP
jgi:hypothetical protein